MKLMVNRLNLLLAFISATFFTYPVMEKMSPPAQ